MAILTVGKDKVFILKAINLDISALLEQADYQRHRKKYPTFLTNNGQTH